MDYLIHLLILITIYSLLCISMNILLGYLGILYLAHPAIYGIGAYNYALLSADGWGFFPTLILSGFFGLLANFILALPAFRLKSHYIGMTSLGFLIIINGLFINLRDLTRGALGIPGIQRPTIFGYTFDDNLAYLLLTLAIVSICAAFLYRILHSPFAKVIEAIREDETAAKTIGKNISKYKLQIFLITGFFGGIGGALLAAYLGFINPWNFAISELTIILAMTVIGGMASFWGSILGATIIILLPEPLRFLDLPASLIGPLRYALYGLLIIAFMIFKPTGILGRRTKLFSK